MKILDFLPVGYVYKRAASTSGGELAGPCPFCGGKDRFRVWPDKGRYWCRQCGARGDEIQLLRDLHSLSFAEACEKAGRRPAPERGAARRTKTPGAPDWKPKAIDLPPVAWMSRARAFLDVCEPGGDYAASRGLTPQTVTSLSIRWNPVDRWESRAAWGLAPETNHRTGKPRKVWLPAGLVIPTWRKAGIVALKIRRAAWTPEDSLPKYAFVAGGAVAPLALGRAERPMAVVESELDAILIHQEAGDIVCAVALGSASNRPDASTAGLLATAPVVLVALDFDRAGAEAWAWWRKHFPTAKRWAPVQGKDVGDLIREPGLVRSWVEAGLLPRLPHNDFHSQVASRKQSVGRPLRRPHRASGLPAAPDDASQGLRTVLAMAAEWSITMRLDPDDGLGLWFVEGFRSEDRRAFLAALDRCEDELVHFLDRQSRGRWA